MNINWQEIKEKYPKAYKIITGVFLECYVYEFGEKIGVELYKFDFPYKIKPCYCDLEKFFREQGVIIEIYYDMYEEVYYYNILDKIKKEILFAPSENDMYEENDEAKEQALYKAFEILEGKL